VQVISNKLKEISKTRRKEEYAHHVAKGMVSVCIPNYNKEPFLEECLNSVAKQTYKNKMEIIIIDDKSSDGSWNVIQNFKRKNHGFKIMTYQTGRRLGTSWAQNIAYYHAQGEYIMNMDSDDYIDPDKVERQLEYMKAHELDACGTNFKLCDRTIENVAKMNGGYWLEYDPDKIKEDYDKEVHRCCFGTMMFHHSVIEDCGGMNKKFIGTEDYEMIKRISDLGYRIGNLKDPLYYYRIHDGQRSKLFHAK
jgi:glycosyltransferase involved in cell wall biosynthesis